MTNKFSLRIAACISIALLLLNTITACSKVKTVTDYPVNETVSESEDEGKKSVFSVKEDENVEPDFTKFNNAEPFNEDGEFVYDPTALRPGLDSVLANDNLSLLLAKEILKTISEGGDTFEMDLETNIPQVIFDRAYKLACVSNPIAYIAEFQTDDYRTFTISYPDYFDQINEEGIYEYTGKVHDMADEMPGFEYFITNTINDNVFADDTETEKARKIYKFMIEKYSILDDYSNVEIDPESNMGTEHNDVLKHYDTDALYRNEFIMLYRFFLTQMNIQSVYSVCIADCQVDHIKELFYESQFVSPDEPGVQFLEFIYIFTDGNTYICNPYYESLEYRYDQSRGHDKGCECKFFGLSRKTFDETANTDGGFAVPGDYEDFNNAFPEPEEDYIIPE